jgi:hypothetical protein
LSDDKTLHRKYLRFVALKIRVLGAHNPSRGMAVPSWTYRAEVLDESDISKPVWTCTHDHESPQLAHGCAANWIEDAEQNTTARSA